MTDVKKRFWSKVNQGADCWEWVAAKTGSGYGEFWIEGKMEGAHRVSYEMKYGSIPDGLFVCHTCDNPVCVNPNHLFVGTHSDNMQDMVKKGRASAGGWSGGLSRAMGSKHGHAKLTECKVVAIRNDTRLHREIAEDYNVTRRTISDIKKHTTWKHVT